MFRSLSLNLLGLAFFYCWFCLSFIIKTQRHLHT